MFLLLFFKIKDLSVFPDPPTIDRGCNCFGKSAKKEIQENHLLTPCKGPTNLGSNTPTICQVVYYDYPPGNGRADREN